MTQASAIGDYRVQDPANAKLRLRDDLVIVPRRFDGRSCHLVEDPLRSKFFRLGLAEFTFASLLDGSRTVRQAVGLTAATLGADALKEEEALGIAHWLVETGLATSEASTTAERTAIAVEKQRQRNWRSKLNILCIKVPLFNPDQLLQKSIRWTGWLLGGPSFVAWLAVCAYSVYLVCSSWDHFNADASVVLDPANWWRMGLAWLLLKVVHEAFHGLACKKYGGHVPQAGVMIIFGMPLPYVDVTSSWRFASKYQRMCVAAAGMYVEMFLAAIAIIVWANSSAGLIRCLAYDVAIMASLHTLAFNGNFLLRFDGYYVFADWLEVSNLYVASQQQLGRWFDQFVLGWNVAVPPQSRRMQAIVGVYGLAALAWRVCMYLLLALAFVGGWSYCGGAAAIALGLLWFGFPLGRFLFRRWKRDETERINRKRLACANVVAVGALAIIAALGMMPASISAPAVVEFAPLSVLRADAAGFVREMRVRAGDSVHASQVIAVLENGELLVELADHELAIQKSLVQGRIHRQLGEIGKEQIEAEERNKLELRRDVLRTRIESLTVRAPSAGHVIGRNLDSLVGQYLKAGDEICVLGNEDAKELLVAVSQEDFKLFSAQLALPVDVRVLGASRGWLNWPLTKVEPRADNSLPHPALSARVRGPLPVRVIEEDISRSQKATYELLTPHFCARVELPADESLQCRAGQIATVHFRSSAETFGEHAYASLRQWVHSYLDRFK